MVKKQKIAQYIKFVWKESSWIMNDKGPKIAKVVKDGSFSSGLGFNILGSHQMWDYNYVIQNARMLHLTKKELLAAQVEAEY